MICYTCKHADVYEQPQNFGYYSIYGRCYKDKQAKGSGYPIYVPGSNCKCYEPAADKK